MFSLPEVVEFFKLISVENAVKNPSSSDMCFLVFFQFFGRSVFGNFDSNSLASQHYVLGSGFQFL